MRKIVMDTGALYRLKSDEKVFEAIKNAGFKYFDYSLFWKGTCEHIGVGDDFRENAHKVKELADSYGLKCEQTHTFFTGGLTQDSIDLRTNYIKKDIESSSILGAKCTVVHPISGLSSEENIKWIKENFLPLAHKFNIKLAIENTWDDKDHKISRMCTSAPEDFVNFIDAFNDDHIVACLDLGHAEINQLETSAVDMIKALGHRIYALHIHDNDKWCDAHQVPYTQKINFNKILKALKEIGYAGNITFEVETCYNRGEDPEAALPFELFPAFLRLEYEIGKYFADFLDK